MGDVMMSSIWTGSNYQRWYLVDNDLTLELNYTYDGKISQGGHAPTLIDW